MPTAAKNDDDPDCARGCCAVHQSIRTAMLVIGKDGGMWSHWWSIPLGVIGGLIALWLALVAALWFAKPGEAGLRDAARLLPDLVRLLKRLATDPTAPRGIRIRVGLLLGYLALPIDLIPDFIPVIGYADDAVIVALVLRSVARTAGTAKLAEHWPGSPEGLAGLLRLCRLPQGHERE